MGRLGAGRVNRHLAEAWSQSRRKKKMKKVLVGALLGTEYKGSHFSVWGRGTRPLDSCHRTEWFTSGLHEVRETLRSFTFLCCGLLGHLGR